jgi:FHS family L-fucose permease-like MFS transporter
MFAANARINIMLFSIVNIINLIIAVNMHNSYFAVWAVLSIGIFNSVMWPNIFNLSLEGLGKYKEQASSFLVMMILGGAILPVLQGRVADASNIVVSFVVPMLGYVYILLYSIFYSRKHFNLIK